MPLTGTNSLPLQVEKTERKRREPHMSPIGKYFGGKGKQVLSDMQNRYGTDDGKRAFYATANKQGQTPDDKPKPAKRRMTFGQRIAAKD